MEPEEKSIEERLGDALGVEDNPIPEEAEPEPTEEEVDDDAPEPIDELEPVVEGDDHADDSVDVEIDGIVYAVPKALEDKFLFQKDYTQKTQTLATDRKQVELGQKQVEIAQSQNKFLAEIQPELSTIGYLDAQIGQLGKDLQDNVNTLTSDQLFKRKIELDGMKENRQALALGLQEKYKGFEEASQQSHQELMDKGAQILQETIPDWNESKQKEMQAFALSEGFSEQEIAGILYPRQVNVLWKAAQFDKLQSGVKGAVQKVKDAPTIQPKSRANAMPEGVKRKLNLRKKLDSAKRTTAEKADLLREEMGKRFG